MSPLAYFSGVQSVRCLCLASLLLMIGCASPRAPHAPNAENYRGLGMFFNSFIYGKDYRSTVTGKMLDEAPRWCASKDAPPLPPRVAARAALAELSRVIGDVSGWKLQYIELAHPADYPPFEESWVYEVQFNGPPVTGPRKNVVTLAVLLNGKTAPLEPSPPKR